MKDVNKQIDEALHPERNGLLIKRGVVEGANYKDVNDFMFIENMKAVRNQLRQELRNKANKRFGGKL